jgi:phage-related protein
VSASPKLACVWYRSATGTEPVREWVRGLPEEVRREIGADLFYVQAFWPTGMPRVRSLGAGLHELRTTAGRNEYRLFFCVEGDTLVVLHGFQKKTQKTPDDELATARTRLKKVKGTP